MKNFLNSAKIGINFGSINNINLKENSNLINIYIYNMYNLGHRHNFITFSINENDNENENENENDNDNYNYNYGFIFNSIREWLFS